MSFKAWLKQYSKFYHLKVNLENNLQRRLDEKEYQLDRESSDEEDEIINVDGDQYEYVTD